MSDVRKCGSMLLVPILLASGGLLGACTETAAPATGRATPVTTAPMSTAPAATQTSTSGGAQQQAVPAISGTYRQSDDAIRWMRNNGNRGPHTVTFSADGATATVSSLEAPDFTLVRQGGSDSTVYAGDYRLTPDATPLGSTFTFSPSANGDVVPAVMLYGARSFEARFIKQAR